MTQPELIEALATGANVTTTEAEQFLTGLSTAIIAELKAGKNVAVPELGIFELLARTERTGRHPKTGQPLKIPAQTVVHFRPTANFKRLVNP